MTDIATLGVKVETGDVTAAKRALDAFAASATPAARAVADLEKATSVSNAELGRFVDKAGKLREANEQFVKVKQGADELGAAVGKTSDTLGGLGTSLGGLGTTLGGLGTTLGGLGTPLAKTKDTLGGLGTTLGGLGTPLAKTKDGLGGLGKPIGDIQKTGQLASYEMINLSRQIQDVGVSLVSGQSPFLVAIQQGTQMADIFSSSKTGTVGGALKQVGSGILSFLTPVRALGLGITAVGVAGYYMSQSLKSDLLVLDDMSKAAGTTINNMRALQTAAAVKGINTEDFAKGMTSFASATYLAKNNMGGLADVFAVNNVRAKSFDDAMEKAADLIKNASSDQQRLQLLQQMGLPATMEWVRLLSGGSEAIKKARDEAVNFNSTAEGQLVASARKFDEAWNSATTKIGQYFKSWMLDALTGLANLTSKAAVFTNALAGVKPVDMLKRGKGERLDNSTDVSGFYDSLGSGQFGNTPAKKPPATIDPNVAKNAIALEQQRLGILGQVATVEQQVKAVELQIAAARLNHVNITAAEAAKLKELAQLQALGITQMRTQKDAYNVETATIGMTTGAATAYAAAQNVINQYARIGITLKPEQIAQIKAEAAALGEAAQRMENMRFAYDTTQSFFQQFGQNIRNGSSLWDAFKNAGVSALGTIADKLMKMAVDNLWTNAFGGSSGGGGLLSSLFGMGGGSSTVGAVNVGSYAMPTIGFAGGGYTGSGGKYQPAGIVHRGEYVFDAASTSKIGVGALNSLRGYAGGGLVAPAPSFGDYSSGTGSGSGGAVSAPISINIDATGADSATLSRVQGQLAQLKAELPARVVEAVTTAKKQRKL